MLLELGHRQAAGLEDPVEGRVEGCAEVRGAVGQEAAEFGRRAAGSSVVVLVVQSQLLGQAEDDVGVGTGLAHRLDDRLGER